MASGVINENVIRIYLVEWKKYIGVKLIKLGIFFFLIGSCQLFINKNLIIISRR